MPEVNIQKKIELHEYMQKAVWQAYNIFSDQLTNPDLVNCPLCFLKNINFPITNPDYSDYCTRLLYFLRYLPAYLAEYKFIYDHIFSEIIFDLTKISILSIGGGSQIDKIGAAFSLDRRVDSPQYKINYHAQHFLPNTPYYEKEGKLFLENPPFRYVSVDIEPWLNTILFDINNIQTIRYHLDIAQYTLTQPCNIIFFPKSIGEIPPEALENFITINSGDYFENNLCIVASMCSPSDEGKLDSFINDFCDKYKYQKQQIPMKSPDVPSLYYQCNLNYPDVIINYINNLPNYCNSNVACPCVMNTRQSCNGCDDSIGRSPILRTCYFYYNIYFLDKSYAFSRM